MTDGNIYHVWNINHVAVFADAVDRSASSIARSHYRLSNEAAGIFGNNLDDGNDIAESSTSAFTDLHNAMHNNVLSLTQRLAFPEQALTSGCRQTSKNYIETESNLDFFAKIVTLLVLVFVIVLITGVLVKRYHTPN